jgi:siroheme synthase (precorrin-2 oxidase/ferrochelatase)
MAVAAEPTRRGVVNSADDRPTARSPRRRPLGPVVVAVGSGGTSPALASHLRDRIAAELLDDRVEARARVARQRREIQQAGGSTEDVEWAARVAVALGRPPSDG